MSDYEWIDDLYAYNSWANESIAVLCDDLHANQLDTKQPIGFGSLRATLFHILAAEQVWMERWTGVPWRPFPTDPEGMTLTEFRRGLAEVAAQRRSLIEINRRSRWTQKITYQDSKKVEYTHRLADLLLHVANHGVHHRAQALQYLKKLGQDLPVGIDYLFYRLAASSLPQTPDAISSLNAIGLEVSTLDVPDPKYDATSVNRFCDYHDWANQRVVAMCDTVDVASLDKDFGISSGTIRSTLLHLLSVETWWVGNWTESGQSFPEPSPETSIAEIRDSFAGVAAGRDTFIASVDDEKAMEVITVRPQAPPTSFRIGETITQVLLHGTHHRAQIINMLKRSSGRIDNIDLLYWPELSAV